MKAELKKNTILDAQSEGRGGEGAGKAKQLLAPYSNSDEGDWAVRKKKGLHFPPIIARGELAGFKELPMNKQTNKQPSFPHVRFPSDLT